MTTNEHLLQIAAEECAEVAQRISKALRFGLSETQPDQLYDNAERIVHEYADLLGVMRMLQDRDLLPLTDPRRIEAKQEKVTHFLKYSREVGTLND